MALKDAHFDEQRRKNQLSKVVINVQPLAYKKPDTNVKISR